MEYNLEIAKLQSHANLVKILARIAVSSTAFTIIVLLFGFELPDPVIFVTILFIPVAFCSRKQLHHQILSNQDRVSHQ